MSWSAKFDRPIQLARGQTIKTLGEARAHILRLPKSEIDKEAWQAATEAVLMAGEGRGPIMHANIGMHRAIEGPQPEGEPRSGAKHTHWGRRKPKRDE